MITKTYKLDVTPFRQKLIVNLNQYDEAFVLNFELYSSEGTLTIESDSTVTISGKKSDGTYYSASAYLNGTTVTVYGDKQITAASGSNLFELCIKNGNVNLYTANFVIQVEPIAMPIDEETSESVIRELKDVQSATSAANSATTSALSAATNANNVKATVQALVDTFKDTDVAEYVQSSADAIVCEENGVTTEE